MGLEIAEVARESDDIKEFREGGDKCPRMMNIMSYRLLKECPQIKQSPSIYGMLLSELQCTPLMLKVLFREVELLVTGYPLQYPEKHPVFAANLSPILCHA